LTTNRPEPDLARLRIDREPKADAPRRRRRRFPILPFSIGLLIVGGAALLFTTDLLPFRRPAVSVARARVTERAGGGGAGGAPVLSATGYVVARVRAAVAPEVTGRLVELRVDVGDHVERGAVIGRLADEDLVAREKQSVAEVAATDAMLGEERAQRDDLMREAARQRELLARGLTSQSIHDAAQTAATVSEARIATATARLETSRASLNVVRAQLEKMRIRAPFDGTVLEKNAELGEIVGPTFGGSSASGGGGVPVVTMADLKSVEVEVDVNETYIRRIKPGLKAQITLDAYPDQVYEGEIRQIVPTADRQRATVQVKVSFTHPDELVLPEMGARVAFLAPVAPAGEAAAERTLQVWVPEQAIRRTQDAMTVYVLRGDRVAEMPVEIGPQLGSDVQILKGLGPGERVILGETKGVAPGKRVRVRAD
jgi:RND family efflux transporter MFP subunit